MSEVANTKGRIEKAFSGSNALALSLIALAVVVSYWNTLNVQFILDDWGSIYDNKTIRHLWPPTVVFPNFMKAATVGGRPLLNYTFAINYAIHGLDYAGYHIANLIIHFLAGSVLFLLLRGCFDSAGEDSAFRTRSPYLALATALLWVVHPLNTQAVTYIVQRAESLASLFYLLVLYFLLRSKDSGKPRIWLILSVVSCLLGMTTKEIVFTAPLAALLFDITFISGSLKGTLKARKLYHAIMWLTSVVVFALLASTGFHANTTGLGSGITVADYMQTEIWVLAEYLRLAFFPAGQQFHYGSELHTGFAVLWPRALLLGALAAGTVYLLVSRPKTGFAATMFFIILAPTSSIVPIVDPMFEHRMYLPLACVVTLAVCAAQELAERSRGRLSGHALVLTAFICVVGLSSTTIKRNELYRSEALLWQDVIDKQPGNFRAYEQLGMILNVRGDLDEALDVYLKAYSLKREDEATIRGLATVLRDSGRQEEALPFVEGLIGRNPGRDSLLLMKAELLMELGRYPESLALFQHVEERQPDNVAILNSIGLLFWHLKRDGEAVRYLGRAASLAPGVSSIRNDYGVALYSSGRPDLAKAEFEAALRIDPKNAEARKNLNMITSGSGKH